MCGIDDFQQEGFDSFAHGFVGGRHVQHREPEAAARDRARPAAARPAALGEAVQGPPAELAERHRRPDPARRPGRTATNFVDLDPVWRDTSGLGLPVTRVTYDLHPNEDRLIGWMQAKAAELLRLMGATSTWPTARFKGVLSSHDLGGARMGEDPATIGRRPRPAGARHPWPARLRWRGVPDRPRRQPAPHDQRARRPGVASSSWTASPDRPPDFTTIKEVLGVRVTTHRDPAEARDPQTSLIPETS